MNLENLFSKFLVTDVTKMLDYDIDTENRRYGVTHAAAYIDLEIYFRFASAIFISLALIIVSFLHFGQ